jgi:hypothetical protein
MIKLKILDLQISRIAPPLRIAEHGADVGAIHESPLRNGDSRRCLRRPASGWIISFRALVGHPKFIG